MAETSAPLSVDSATDQVMSLLGDDTPAEQTPIEQLSDEAKADRIASEPEPAGDEQAVAETEQEEPEVPAIDPPVSWKADAKEKFNALPRELQEVIANRERERESHFGKTQQELTAKEKAIEAERQSVQNERQTYAQRLTQIIEQAQTMDPVIAEGRKTDWAKAHADDPLGAPAKYFAWQQREQQLNAMAQQRDQISNQIRSEMLRKAEERLSTELKDEWTNPDKRKAFQSDVKKVLQDVGFSEDEFAGVTDARALLVARKAALYDKLMAQQASIAAAKKSPPAPKTILKSQASADKSDPSERTAKVLQRVKSVSRMADQAALIASLVD